MAAEAHHLLPVRRGGVVDASESKKSHGDRVMDLSAPPYDVVAPFCARTATVTGSGGTNFADDNAAAAASRKRGRGEEQFPGAVAAHAKQRVMLGDVHPAVLQLVQKMKAEIEQWRRYAAHAAAAANASVADLLRAKDEEIGRVQWLNWALQAQVRDAHAQAQAWRRAALSGEAAVAALRADLGHALRAQAEVAPADAGSSCCGENSVNTGRGTGEARTGGPGESCRGCGELAAAELLLPCRHLTACPACGCRKVGTVAVNLVQD